nr:MAG TPA_asm: hypothetical protein [Caudoviricetes sp.]
MPTLKACALHATAQRRRENGSQAGRGEGKSLLPLPFRTARLIKFLRAQNKEFFSGRFRLLDWRF